MLMLFLCSGTAVRAQSSDDPAADTQIWPDTQVTVKLDRNHSLIIHGTIRLGRNNTAFVNEQIGAGLRRAFGRHFSASINYRYLHSEPTPSRQQRENRIFVDLTPRVPLGKGFQLQDRNRIEWRDVNNCGCSYRYRNRIQLERAFNIGEKQLTPYVSSEFFYDTRFRAWNRSQHFVGMRVPLNKHLTFDGFYMRQIDGRVNPGFLHVIGTFLRVEM